MQIQSYSYRLTYVWWLKSAVFQCTKYMYGICCIRTHYKLTCAHNEYDSIHSTQQNFTVAKLKDKPGFGKFNPHRQQSQKKCTSIEQSEKRCYLSMQCAIGRQLYIW